MRRSGKTGRPLLRKPHGFSSVCTLLSGLIFSTTRLASFVLGLFNCLCYSSYGATAQDDPLAGLDLTPLMPVWNQYYTVSTSIGYKDNVLLAAHNPEASGFINNGFDITIWRRPIDDGREFQFAISAADRRYWHHQSVGHEDWG